MQNKVRNNLCDFLSIENYSLIRTELEFLGSSNINLNSFNVFLYFKELENHIFKAVLKNILFQQRDNL